MIPIREAQKGHPLRASDLNAQTAELQRVGKITVSGGTVAQTGTGIHLEMNKDFGFWAQITSRAGFKYGFVEQDFTQKDNLDNSYYYYQSVTGQVSDIAKRASIGSKDYAREANGNVNVPSGTIVYMRPGAARGTDGENGQMYLFNFDQYGGASTKQSVIVDVASDFTGILLTKHDFYAYNSNAIFSPTLLGCSDVLQKSLAGQRNRALVVNSLETGFEFGASLAPSTGAAAAQTQITALSTKVDTLTSQLSTINATLSALASRLTNLGV